MKRERLWRRKNKLRDEIEAEKQAARENRRPKRKR